MKKGYPTHSWRVTTDLKQLVKTAAKVHPDNVYLRYKQKSTDEIIDITYAEFDEMTDAFGTSLFAMGLAGKHIAVIGDTSPEWIATYLCVVGAGGVIIPLDRELSPEEIGNFLARAGASAVVYCPRFRQVFEELSERLGVEYFIEMGGECPDKPRFMTTDTLITNGKALLDD
jgi:long-chain acyl-CoA synthetase